MPYFSVSNNKKPPYKHVIVYVCVGILNREPLGIRMKHILCMIRSGACVCVRVFSFLSHFLLVCVICMYYIYHECKFGKRGEHTTCMSVQQQPKTPTREKDKKDCGALRSLFSFFFSCAPCVYGKYKNYTVGVCANAHLQPLFTDLSVAGLPAELKHITQRRKRKQP